MDIKSYADILRFAIKLQMEEVNECIEAAANGLNEEWYSGIKQGLEIALEKIDASMFLVER